MPPSGKQLSPTGQRVSPFHQTVYTDVTVEAPATEPGGPMPEIFWQIYRGAIEMSHAAPGPQFTDQERALLVTACAYDTESISAR